MKIEYDIVDHCNLNCKNCGHSSQFKSNNEKSLSQIKSEIGLLQSKIPISIFRIVGGEPLLHSNIATALIILRNIFGHDTDITLVTNGIKLLKMRKFFFEVLNRYNIRIEISKYPIKINYSDIEKLLIENNVKYKISTIDYFYNFIDSTGVQDASESFTLCRSKFYCPFYDGLNIFLCAYVKNVPFINSKDSHKIQHDYVSVYDPIEVITKYLSKSCSTCSFCKSTRQPEPWRVE